MHFLNCYHPVEIERYGQKHYVPCGHCDYCRYIRNKSMSERLQLEFQHYKYAYFFTLTYSNTFVPKMRFSKDFRCLYCDADFALHGTEDSGLMLDGQFWNAEDFKTIENFDNTFGYVPVLRKADLQKFIKRFRRNVDYYLIQRLLKHGKITENQKQDFNIYYSFCGEYGPTNLRPHYHGIMFFNQHLIAKAFNNLLHKSWSFGRCSYKQATAQNHCKYISDYVNASYRLPKFYQRFEIRPFRLFSKAHPVGLPSISDEEIKRIFLERAPTMFYEDIRGKRKETALWSCVERNLFPRFVAYNQINRPLKIELIKDALCYDTFKDYELEYMRFYPNYYSSPLPFLSTTYKSDYERLFNQFMKLVCKGTDINQPRRLKSSALYSIYHTASVISRNMQKFSVSSVADYIDIIDEYLHNVEQYKLKNQFEFENTFYNLHPDWLKYIDIGMYDIDDILNNTSDMTFIHSKIQFEIETSHKNRKKSEVSASDSKYTFDKNYLPGDFTGFINY